MTKTNKRIFTWIITLAVFTTTCLCSVLPIYAELPPETSAPEEVIVAESDSIPEATTVDETTVDETAISESPIDETAAEETTIPIGDDIFSEPTASDGATSSDGETDSSGEELEEDPDLPYVSHIMIGMDVDSATAKKIITDRGFKVVDYDLNGGTGGNFVYLGYKTTDNVNLALTDIKVRRLHSADMAKADVLNYVYNGITYTSVVTAYGEKTNPIDSTITGLMYREMGTYEFGNTMWESVLESVFGSGAITLDAFLDAQFGGFADIIDVFFTAEREERGSILVYSTRSPLAGSPIVPDFLGSRSESVPAGYSPVTRFATELAQDFNMLYVDRYTGDHYYNKVRNFLFFRHEAAPFVSGGGEYLSEVVLYNFTKPLIGSSSAKSEFMRDAEMHGFTFYDFNLFPGLDGEAYIAYKTTNDPDKAITDIRLMGTVKDDKFADSITFKEGSTYTAVHVKRANAPWLYLDYTNDTAFYGNHSMPKRSLYITTSKAAGEPIKAEFLGVNNYDDVDFSEWSPVVSFMENEIMDFTRGSGGATDAYLFYKRPADIEKPAEKKYYEKLVPIFAETKDAAMALALEEGCEGIIKVANGMGEWRVTNWGGGDASDYREVYIAYKKTDRRSAAITGIINWHDEPLVNSYYKPSKSLKVDGIPYQHAGILTPYVRIRHFSDWLDYKDTVVGYGGFSSMYTTTSSRAGAPITDLFVSNLPIVEGYSEVVKGVHGTDFGKMWASNMTQGRDTTSMLLQEVKLADAYLLYNRQDSTEKLYISELRVAADEDTREGAITRLSWENVTSFIDFDFNYATGEDYVYIGYNRTADRSEAITGIITTHNQPHSDTITHNGMVYYSAGHVDTNTNVGGSDTIFVYYTKDRAAGDPITAIRGNEFCSLKSFEVVNSTEGHPSNLNKGASRRTAYLFLSRDTSSNGGYTASVISDSEAVAIVVFGSIILVAVIIVTVVVRKKKKS